MINNFVYICVFFYNDGKIKIENKPCARDIIDEALTLENNHEGYVQCYTNNPEYKDSDWLFYYRQNAEDCKKSANTFKQI